MNPADLIDKRIAELEAEIEESTKTYEANRHHDTRMRSQSNRHAHESEQARRRGGVDELKALRSRL